jgi:Spy/CpxP family protein refolding chaperone
MKQLIRFFLLAMTISVASTSMAQDSSKAKPKRSPEELTKMQTQQYKRKLSLTAEQEPKVSAILLDYSTKLVAARDSKGGKMKKMQELKHLSDAKDNSMKTVLTEQQYTDYLKLMEEQKEKLKERRGGQKVRR